DGMVVPGSLPTNEVVAGRYDVIGVLETQLRIGEVVGMEELKGYEWQDCRAETRANAVHGKWGVGAWMAGTALRHRGLLIEVIHRTPRIITLKIGHDSDGENGNGVGNGNGKDNGNKLKPLFVVLVYAPVEGTARSTVEEFWNGLSEQCLV